MASLFTLSLAKVSTSPTSGKVIATVPVTYNLKTETWGQTIPLAAGQRRLPGAYIWAKVNRSLDQREYLDSAGASVLSDTEFLYNSKADVAVSFGYVADSAATTELTTLYFDGVQVDLSKITYTFYNGAQTTADPTIVADKGATQTPAFKGQAYIVIRNLDLSKFANKFPAISAVLTDTGGGTTTLEWSITNRATLLGELTASDFTFTNMTPTYPGFMVWQNSDLKTHLQNDGLLFGFDFFESGGKIKVVRKVDGSTYSSDRTLVDNDLLDLGPGQAFDITRGDEQDVPAVVHCNYVDVSVEYRMSRQRARRVQTPTPSLNSNNTADLTTSVIMTASNALSAAARAMFRMDVGRVSVSFRLPQKHIDIEPGDILILPTIGTKIFTVKVQEATLREDLSLDVAASVLLTDEDISLTGAEGDGLIIDMSEPSVAVGTADGVGTASGVGSFVVEGETTGTASGAGSATAIGAAIAEGVGAASGAGSASAESPPAPPSEADGTAASAGSASAVGVSAAAADGAAVGAGSASATGASTAAATGTASGVGSATGSSMWQPSSLSSLQAWYDAQEQSEADGADVATFFDQSGNGYDAPWQNSQPNMSTSGITGYKSIVFNSVRRERFTLPAGLMSGKTAGSYFAVARRVTDPAPTAGDGGPIIYLSGDNSSLGSHWGFTDGIIYENFGTNARKTVGNPTPSLASPRIYSAHSGSADYRAYLDGSLLFSTGTNTVEWDLANRWIGHTTFGANVYTFVGYIAEIIIFDSVLTTSEREKVEGYLAHKYGLTANLPSGHPYILSPPT